MMPYSGSTHNDYTNTYTLIQPALSGIAYQVFVLNNTLFSDTYYTSWFA